MNHVSSEILTNKASSIFNIYLFWNIIHVLSQTKCFSVYCKYFVWHYWRWTFCICGWYEHNVIHKCTCLNDNTCKYIFAKYMMVTYRIRVFIILTLNDKKKMNKCKLFCIMCLSMLCLTKYDNSVKQIFILPSFVCTTFILGNWYCNSILIKLYRQKPSFN